MDESSADDSEFTAAAGDELRALEDSPAQGKIDLLTVLVHEFGHRLGLKHSLYDAQGDAFMAAGLRPSPHRAPAR